MFKLFGSQERQTSHIFQLMAGAASLVAGLSLAVSGVAAGQDDTAEAGPALYVVEDEDSTVYVFGTFHLLPPELEWRTETFDAAFASADTLYLEADVASPEGQAAARALIPQLAFNEPGVTLRSLVSEESVGNVSEFLTGLGLSPDAVLTSLDPMKPWFASLSLAVLGIQAAGFDPNAGVERVLSEEAIEAGMDFGFFETAEQQLRFFADMPMELQISQFEVNALELLQLQEGVTSLVEAWAGGDLEALTEMMNGAMRETSPEVYEVIIVRRNENWIPDIEEILAGSGTQFIAVGALHLPGEHGVIPLLEEAGYTVRRVQ